MRSKTFIIPKLKFFNKSSQFVCNPILSITFQPLTWVEKYLLCAPLCFPLVQRPSGNIVYTTRFPSSAKIFCNNWHHSRVSLKQFVRSSQLDNCPLYFIRGNKRLIMDPSFFIKIGREIKQQHSIGKFVRFIVQGFANRHVHDKKTFLGSWLKLNLHIRIQIGLEELKPVN